MRSPRAPSGSGIISDAGRIAGIVLPVLAPIVVGGMALALMKAGVIRRIFSGEEESLNRAQRLSRTILGNNKHAVAAALGPPEGSAGNRTSGASLGASTWYYRLDDRHHIALAIEFVNDVAAEASVLHAKPRPHAGIARSALA
jgi:hypothetical protein